MRWFKWRRGQEPKEPEEAPKPSWWPQMLTVFDLYPIGFKFVYCGRVLLVTGHRHYIRSHANRVGCFPGMMPAVVVDYADERGEIHTFKFGIERFALLLILQRR